MGKTSRSPGCVAGTGDTGDLFVSSTRGPRMASKAKGEEREAPGLEVYLKHYTQDEKATVVKTDILAVASCPEYDDVTGRVIASTEIPIVYPGGDGLLRVIGGLKRVHTALERGEKELLVVQISAQRYEWIKDNFGWVGRGCVRHY